MKPDDKKARGESAAAAKRAIRALKGPITAWSFIVCERVCETSAALAVPPLAG